MGVLAASVNAVSQASTNQWNYDIQKMTNRSNERIAAANNEAQIKLWREQQAHDLDMWNRENAYNDPSAQMERLKAAGINPLMIAGDTGNASSFAGGQTPPTLVPPTMQAAQMKAPDVSAMANDLGQFSEAYKNIMSGKKEKAEAGLAGFELDSYKQAALEGANPHIYKSKVLLEEYAKLKKENKYISPYMEAQLRKFGAETNLTNEFVKVRKEECKKMKVETKSLRLTNKFNAEMFPKQLAEIGERIKSEIQKRKNETAVAESVVKANDASAALSESQAGFVDTQKQGEEYKNVERQLRAELAKVGVNPDDKNLPFFAGLGIKLMNQEITAPEVSELFQFITYADRVGWDKVAKSNANLSKFQMLGQKSGLFGSGFDLPSLGSVISGMLLGSPSNNAGTATYPK